MSDFPVIMVALDNVRSALNVGAIFRTCDGAGVSKILLGGITPYPPHVKILKTSLGAEEFVPFEYTKDLLQTLISLQKKGFTILSLEETLRAVDYFKYDFSLNDKYVFVFGNEITGVSQRIQELSDETLMLPMRGSKNSLNVATTVGIVLYNTMFSRKP